jgi:TolA-binding protein
VIPTVSNLFSRLTQSYERDIFEKDQDILEARNMLHGIQTEIREGHQTIHELKLKTAALSQAEEQIRTLEGLIKQEIHTRQRLRLEELITQEEESLRKDTEVNGADNGVVNGQNGDKALSGSEDVQMNEAEPTTTTSATDGSAPIPAGPVNTTIAPPTGAATESSATNRDPTAVTGVPAPGEQVPTSNENPTSTSTLPSSDNTPATTTSSTSSSSTKLQSLETEVEELQSKLSQLQQQRKDRVNQIVQLKSTQGKRWYEYQRLIALCCNVSVDQVDDLLDPLLNSLAGKDVEV